jgi:hypothetical protein
MKAKLPHVINVYVRASDAHDVKAILACFSGRATVRDEDKTVRGLKAIEHWTVEPSISTSSTSSPSASETTMRGRS